MELRYFFSTTKKKSKTSNALIECDETGFYVASVPDLAGCQTQAKSLDTLMLRVKEAMELCLMEQPAEITANEFIGVQRVAAAL